MAMEIESLQREDNSR